MVRVTRDVAEDDPGNYLGRAAVKGERFYKFTGTTYGCVDKSGGVALSEHGESVYPCFEFPADAVEPVTP